MSKVSESGGPAGKRPASDAKESPKKTKKNDEDDGDGSKQKQASGYYQMKNRAPPQALGSKDLPQGPEDCLQGLDFVITGVLESISREDAEDLVKRHGGTVKSGVSKNTSYLVAGRDAGGSKTKQAKDLETPIMDEDGLFDLIRKAAKNPTLEKNGTASSSTTASSSKVGAAVKMKPKGHDVIMLDSDEDDQPSAKKAKTSSIAASPQKANEMAAPTASGSNAEISDDKPSGLPFPIKKPSGLVPTAATVKTPSVGQVPSATSSKASEGHQTTGVPKRPAVAGASDSVTSPLSSQNASAVLWVDKYQPKALKNVVGQHTPHSPAKKLLAWLRNWQGNRKRLGYTATSAGLDNKSGSGDGSAFKAVLLSGPPGIGKTTSAVLACKEAGYTYVHVNASDHRSRHILQEQFMSGVTSHSLLEYQTGAVTKSAIIMDEVDGMAGNEDRGGVQEVILLIKNCRIPVICICNDRKIQKMRSLAGYCYDLSFHRPCLQPIRGAMLSICAKEGIDIRPNALDVIIEMSRHDIRQILHNLYMWTISKKTMSCDEAKANADASKKDNVRMSAPEACRLMFARSKGSQPGDFVNDKMDLYFADYSFVPLFIFENYLKVRTDANTDQCEALDNVSQAADSFSISDLIDAEVRSRQSWHLLPQHAVFAAVIPGNLMRGAMGAQITFPAWLGKNSSTNKNKRLAQELHTHMRLKTSTSLTGLVMDYLPVMRQALTIPLKNEDSDGVDKVVEFVNSYDMIREDIDSVLDITSWGEKDDDVHVPAAVKSALTRQLNKGTHQNPYSLTEVKKTTSRARAGGHVEADLLDEETAAALAGPDDEDKEEEDVEKDSMIKVKKKRSSAKSASTSKGADGSGARGGRSGSKTAGSSSRSGKK